MELEAIAAWIERFARLEHPVPIPQALGISLALLVLGYVCNTLAFALLGRFTRATKTTLDDELVKRMRIPAAALIILLALHFFFTLRGLQSGLHHVVAIVELLLAAYLGVETFETIVVHYWLGERRGVRVPRVVHSLILAVFYVAAALSIIGSVTGINMLPILTTSTVVTVVIGLALQDTLGNLIAGLVIHAERPFAEGDWIQVDGIEGKVIYLGWRSTRLQTFSWDVVSLPNAVIARARVQNYYAPSKTCARNLEFLVATSASPEAVESAARRACARIERVRTEPAPKVWLVAFTPLFQRYVVKVWLDDFQFHDDIESDLMKALWHELHAAGITADMAAPVAAIEPARPEAPVVAARLG